LLVVATISTDHVRETVDALYVSDSRRVLATLIRLLGDFDAAEEALHEAFRVALEQWPRDGVPANPRAWLVSAGRFKAIDAMRRRARFDASLEEVARRFDVATSDPAARDGESVEDDRLRLIFTCCHPALPPDAQIALTSGEAIRLGRLLIDLLAEPEALGLFALMLLHESRRTARTSPAGELVLLGDQDRSLWNRELIAEGSALVQRALSSRRFGPYTLQAAIAAVHAEAPTASATDWAQIVGLYDVLARADPSPVVELNRAAAVAMRDGPLAGLILIDAILARGDLADYYLAHSARADLCRRLGRTTEARASYERALRLTQQEPERRFLERRLGELPD